MKERAGSAASRSAGCRPVLDRRTLLAGIVASAASGGARAASPREALRFGLTPVFLSNDLGLLADLEAYLEAATGKLVDLVTRRTYQEITALLVSGQLDAAWICGYPFVQFRNRLRLVAVPVWRGDTLYRSYLIVRAERTATDVADLENDLHAFSDPDSNSGFLVTEALLARRGTTSGAFFRKTIFTYGHRNVVRAVASGLADSGSVDGYVLEVLREVEPELASRVAIVTKSEWLGFPPVAAPGEGADPEGSDALCRALLGMADDQAGQRVLGRLRLDGFAWRPPDLYDPIAAKVALVERRE